MTINNNSKMRTAALAWLSCFVVHLLPAAAPAMRSYTIDLPQNVLRFSLPEEIAQHMGPRLIDKSFDPSTNKTFKRDGFRDLVSMYYQIQGPFLVGPYGALRFDFTVVRRVDGYEGDITTVDGLERYVRWWIGGMPENRDFSFGQAELAGVKWVFRWRNTMGGGGVNAADVQAFSFPIDQTSFLRVDFWISETVPGSAPKWKPRAEALREAIKATVVLQPKVLPSSTGAPPR